MSEPQLPREVRRRLAIIRHAEEVTGNVAMTCRYYEISRQVYYRWLRRYQEQGIDGLRDLSRRPHHSPNAAHVDVVGKILYLRQNYLLGGWQVCWRGLTAMPWPIPCRCRALSPEFQFKLCRAAGTGGMLSTAYDDLVEMNPKAGPVLYGQDINPRSYALCKSDMINR